MDLFSQLQASLAGSQAGNAMTQGIVPNVSQPRGSQQLWIAAIAAVRSEISNLHRLADNLRRSGCEDCDREVVKCTHMLQGVLDKLKARMDEKQQGAA